MEKDSFYFPHFYNARHDRKIKRLRKELGIEGYGIFFMLLEVLREQIDFKYPIADIDLLAEEFGTSEQKVRVVVYNYELFSIDEFQHFFSPKLLVYLQPYLKMKEQRKLAARASVEARKKKTLALTEGNLNLTTVERPLSGCEATVKQSKVKESKVKKSKVNEIKENKITESDFESLWSMYPRKLGKGTLTKNMTKTLKTIEKVGFEEFKKAIERYKQYIEAKKIEERFIKHGSTFFNSGYEDFLSDDFSISVGSNISSDWRDI